MSALSSATHDLPLDPLLRELIRVRASMLNGCAYCVDMHTKDARAQGETEQRLYAVATWHEAPFFSPAERAALALTDALTLLPGNPLPDDVVAEAEARARRRRPRQRDLDHHHDQRLEPRRDRRPRAGRRVRARGGGGVSAAALRALHVPGRSAGPPQRLGRRDGPRRRGRRVPRGGDDEQRRRRVARLRGRGGDPGGRDARRGPADLPRGRRAGHRRPRGRLRPRSRRPRAAGRRRGRRRPQLRGHRSRERAAAARHRRPGGRIAALKAAQDLVVNARIDVFLNGGPVAEGLERARAYADAGADCVYPIGIVDEATIAAFVELGTPVNVVLSPAAPPIERLAELGVARISLGHFLHAEMLAALDERLAGLSRRGTRS